MYLHKAPPDTIVIHHSAHPTAGPKQIIRWHIAQGWQDCGYHKMVGMSGSIYAGRDTKFVGAGVRKHNTGKIHVALLGDFTSQKPTEAQIRGLLDCVRSLKQEIPTLVKVAYHSELAPSACPGYFVTSLKLKEECQKILSEVVPAPTKKATRVSTISSPAPAVSPESPRPQPEPTTEATQPAPDNQGS